MKTKEFINESTFLKHVLYLVQPIFFWNNWNIKVLHQVAKMYGLQINPSPDGKVPVYSECVESSYSDHVQV